MMSVSGSNNPITPNPQVKSSTGGILKKGIDQSAGLPLQSPMVGGPSGGATLNEKTPTTAVSAKNVKKRDRDDFN